MTTPWDRVLSLRGNQRPPPARIVLEQQTGGNGTILRSRFLLTAFLFCWQSLVTSRLLRCGFLAIQNVCNGFLVEPRIIIYY